MNSHALFSMVSTCNLVQCRGINNPALSLISPSHYKLQRVTTMTLQAGSTQPLPLVSSNSVSLSRFLSGQSLRLTPLHQKEAFVKKASIKLRIVKAEATSPAQPEKPCPENAPKADVEVTKAADGAQKLKIGVYFAVWWSLNVVFNIYNKKVLNVYPFPWLTSTLSLAAGSAIMLVSWALKIVEAPQVDCDFWKGLAPVAVAHTIGHVAATVSMSKVAVSFTHIIKSSEPAFSVLIQRLVFREHFPVTVYLSLLPIIGGCGLAAATELNFSRIGFVGAMISNVAFVFRNIFSKKGMSKLGKKNVGGMNYYACLSLMSLVFLTPFAFAVEGPKAWATGWKAANLAYGNQVLWWVVAQSVFYHLYNQVSYMSLDEISPLTFSIGNTIKRVTVIVSSIIIFRTKLLPINVVGAAIAILGTFLYSQIKQ